MLLLHVLARKILYLHGGEVGSFWLRRGDLRRVLRPECWPRPRRHRSHPDPAWPSWQPLTLPSPS